MITGIILAAGQSMRLGRPKQLLPLGGRPLLAWVVEAAERSPLDEIVVVVGHRAKEISAAVPARDRVRFALNDDYEVGQSTSFRAGLRAASPESKAAVILLGDQPSVRPSSVATLTEAWRQGAGPVVQATYHGRPGHPILFDREVWPDLEAVSGDQGARALLARHPDWRALVPIEGPFPPDIDTEEDYRRARKAFEHLS